MALHILKISLLTSHCPIPFHIHVVMCLLQAQLSSSHWDPSSLPRVPASIFCRHWWWDAIAHYASNGIVAYRLYRSNQDGIYRSWYCPEWNYWFIEKNWIEGIPMMMSTTSQTTTTRVLAVFSYTTMSGRNMTTMLAGFRETGRHTCNDSSVTVDTSYLCPSHPSKKDHSRYQKASTS